jgi:hypothetical protein
MAPWLQVKPGLLHIFLHLSDKEPQHYQGSVNARLSLTFVRLCLHTSHVPSNNISFYHCHDGKIRFLHLTSIALKSSSICDSLCPSLPTLVLSQSLSPFYVMSPRGCVTYCMSPFSVLFDNLKSKIPYSLASTLRGFHFSRIQHGCKNPRAKKVEIAM